MKENDEWVHLASRPLYILDDGSIYGKMAA